MKKKINLYPIPLDKYHIKDDFWTPKMETVRTEMIPYQWKALNDEILDAKPSHCILNFKIAAGLEKGEFEGNVFQDSDVAKWLEAVGYTLIWKKDEKLEKIADDVIDIIGKAQQPDGYLDTYYIINGLEKRWTNLTNNHELYCAGHMIEAGIAYYQGTGKTALLDIVVKLADCICKTFGAEEDKIHGYPGHEIIEMALVKLYEVTGEFRYVKLAEYFVNERGKAPLFFEEERKRNHNSFPWEDSLFQYQYYQAGKPVQEQKVAEGHAVRAVYLYSGMTEVGRVLEDAGMLDSVQTLWRDVTQKQMYITGAIGSSEYGEAFTFAYDLPNDLIYGETCASIGLVFWAQRMLQCKLKGEYADVLERALYNSCISGMSKDGTRFFYVNPLEVNPEACLKDQRKRHVEIERQKWFSCACCPPNLARLLASLGKYVCSMGENMLAFHLYVGGEMETPYRGMRIQVESHMPWNGEVKIRVIGGARFFYMALRIPGWCDDYTVLLNNEMLQETVEDGYMILSREWKDGDILELCFNMEARRAYANPQVKYDFGKTAITRGPLVYCMEQIDNEEGLTRYTLPSNSKLNLSPGTLENNQIDIDTVGYKENVEGWSETLYAYAKKGVAEAKNMHFIPYYLWNNRGIGEMNVWIQEMS